MIEVLINILKEHWFKISILIILLIGLANYNNYLKNKASLEETKYIESKEVEEQKYLEKKEIEKKEYMAKRRNDCYEIYEKERKNWNNVQDMEYDGEYDVCLVQYKDTKDTWKNIDCKTLLPPKDELNAYTRKYMMRDYINCKSKTFTKEF